MDVGRQGASSLMLAVVAIAIIVVAAGAYLLFASGGTGPTSSSSSSTYTTSCCATNTGPSFRVIMQLQPGTPLAASDVVANYSLQVTVLGTLDAPLVLAANAPAGTTVSFSPAQIQPGSESTAVGVSFTVSSSVNAGMYSMNVTASSSGETSSQAFGFQVVKYLVATVGTSFVPDSLTVPVGSTVYWIRLNGMISQYDNGAHNVVFSTLQAASPTLAQYDSWSYTFGQAGTFSYDCTFHPGMDGQVVVA